MLGRRARIRLGVHVLQVDDLVLRDRPLVEVRVLNRVITAGTRHKRPALNYIGTSTARASRASASERLSKLRPL